MADYTVYGSLTERETVALSTILRAKGIACSLVERSPSIALALAARAGTERGPYLRTPEGFVLAGTHDVLDWIERLHPTPALLPTSPVRRICARLLEDWIELWLPRWPRRSWSTLERLASHLSAAGFLLGPEPTRPDWLLAAWLETEVLIHDHARSHLAARAPRLVALGQELLDRGAPLPDARSDEDVIPISLLSVLEEIAADYHAFLVGNQQALEQRRSKVELDLGLGCQPIPVEPRCEARRIEIGRELASLGGGERREVRAILDPLGAWQASMLPSALPDIDPADPRSL